MHLTSRYGKRGAVAAAGAGAGAVGDAAGACHEPCRDQSEPIDKSNYEIPYDMYYANESGPWGGMGVSFIDTSKPGRALGVAYLDTLARGFRENYPEMSDEEIRDYLESCKK